MSPTMISVIISTKNGGGFLKRSVESVLNQTHRDLELIIVSDGSTDNTAEIARALATTDPRIKVIELKKNIGPGLARNLAILGKTAAAEKVGADEEPDEELKVEPANGNYIALIDDDDVWLSPEKLNRQKEYLDANPGVIAIGAARVEFVREEPSSSKHVFWLNQERDPEKIRLNMLSYNPLITSSVLFRKDAFIKVGGFKAMRLAEDYDLWLRMGQLGKIANVEGAETQYTIRDSGASRSNNIKMCRVVLNLAREYRGRYPNYTKAVIKGYVRLLLALKKSFIKKILK